jgi:hypothetical protein
VLIAASLGLASVGTAQAALFTGAWDPRYGEPFDTEPEVLGWRGSAVFEVPDACIIVGAVSSASCSGMQLISAQVVFYDYLNGTTLDIFNYTAPDLSGFSATFGAGGALISISSNFFSAREPTSDFANIDAYGFRLRFVEAGVQMYHSLDLSFDYLADPLLIPPKWCFDWTGFVCGYSGTYSDGTSAPAVVVTYSKVSEPGSLVLLLAALVSSLLLGWGQRRTPGRRARAC